MNAPYGFEADTRSRFNIPATPLALEASVSYTNPFITSRANRESNGNTSFDFISFLLFSEFGCSCI
ncbi:MAG TPA: hypothetical protein VEC36_13295 [Patescibacteria group bacterium]|nr:hypothetical protein [Patescibacteria group bacterium]